MVAASLSWLRGHKNSFSDKKPTKKCTTECFYKPPYSILLDYAKASEVGCTTLMHFSGYFKTTTYTFSKSKYTTDYRIFVNMSNAFLSGVFFMNCLSGQVWLVSVKSKLWLIFIIYYRSCTFQLLAMTSPDWMWALFGRIQQGETYLDRLTKF